MTYKDVCGENESVWFTLSDMKKEGRLFLQWAKELWCVWMNGKEIEPDAGTTFFTISLSRDGKIANVPVMARASRQFREIKRIDFGDFTRNLKRMIERNGRMCKTGHAGEHATGRQRFSIICKRPRIYNRTQYITAHVYNQIYTQIFPTWHKKSPEIR